MASFEALHHDRIAGKLSAFDRMIFRGHLRQFFIPGAFERFLVTQRTLIKDFDRYVARVSEEMKTHAQRLAAELGRPYRYLEGAHTAARGRSKEDLARAIAQQDHITEGLVCVLATVEPCTSFRVRGNRETHKREIVLARRKGLHVYFYWIDPELGFLHIRLQTWFPFAVQIYVNGREILARKLEREGIAFERYDNALLSVEDLPRAEKFAEEVARRRWPRVFDALVKRIHPFLPVIRRAGFGSYYWVLDQAEIASDVLFRDRAKLEEILPSLRHHALRAFGAEDVMRFLGRKLDPRFLGEVRTDLKKRPEGWRIKHRMKGNSVKLYDKATVLRVETTINQPREFKVRRIKDGVPAWVPMGKGVANVWRYYQVGLQANERYLTALAAVEPRGEALADLDRLTRPRTVEGRRVARLHPMGAEDCALFAAVLAGSNLVRGFRNRDVQNRLELPRPTSEVARKSQCTRISRKIAKLRGHGLIAKVPLSHRYHVTERGYRAMSAALYAREEAFPKGYHHA